ncbi:MAG: alpha/beta hydrolase [Nocardioides sp.]|nr:alpha/beta hydrolase [Nocardioides sp.]
MKHRSLIVIVLAVLVVGGLVASTVVPALLSVRGDARSEPAPEWERDPVPLEPAPDLSTPDGLDRYYEQQLAWRECGERFECARLTVPLDYERPDGRTIEIAVLRDGADDPDNRIGSLVVNPGGPGASGTQFAAQSSLVIGGEVRRAYDIVGFDPRGVGSSAAIDCVDDEQLDALLAADPLPDSPAEEREVRRINEEFAQGCLDRSPDLVRHVSTREAARDIDVLREALGEDRLTWYGASYGTFLGATYAELFPERVGRMVLDGAVDPTRSVREQSLAQARGFETALRAYVENCTSERECFLGDDVDEGVATIADLIDGLDDDPLAVGERELTVGNAFYGLIAPLYNRDYWSYLDMGLQGLQDDNGTLLLSLFDAYASRGPNGYLTNSMEALVAINCLDDGRFVPAAEVEAEYAAFEKVSPTFGRIFAEGLSGCEDWPVRGDDPPDRLTAAGAEPILVTGTTRDPATPLEWAEALAEQLESGILLRRDGDGHTAYGAGNPCVDDTIEGYLVEGRVPDGTVDC